MLRYSGIQTIAILRRRCFLSTSIAREFTYFDNFSIVEGGIAMIRFNGPEKMNTVSTGMQKEFQHIFTTKIINNDEGIR
jgi:hypothetical protein